MRGALLDINNTGTGKAPDCLVEIGFSCPPSESVAGSLHPGNMFGQAAPLISSLIQTLSAALLGVDPPTTGALE